MKLKLSYSIIYVKILTKHQTDTENFDWTMFDLDDE